MDNNNVSAFMVFSAKRKGGILKRKHKGRRRNKQVKNKMLDFTVTSNEQGKINKIKNVKKAGKLTESVKNRNDLISVNQPISINISVKKDIHGNFTRSNDRKNNVKNDILCSGKVDVHNGIISQHVTIEKNLSNSDENNDLNIIVLKNPVPDDCFDYFFETNADGQRIFTPVSNHTDNALKLLSYMMYPKTVDSFMRWNWEKSPLFIKREHSNYYSGLLQFIDIDRILRDNDIYYTRHLDVAVCVDGNRETLSPEGKAQPYAVWDYYNNNCTLRLSSPQMFLPNIHFINVTLQDYFGCYVGANIYLTPPNSQGFAAHYDDIEAFILQIEGRKYWKIYEPKTEDQKLPRYSSRDFKSDELGEPSFEAVLNPGDFLYLPRGYIHQCFSDKEYHSLHITVSAYQCNAWIDLMEKAVSHALKEAWKRDVNYRNGLPLNFLQAAGCVRNKNLSQLRNTIIDKVKSLTEKLADYVNIDKVADEIGNTFVHSSLPPFLTREDKMNMQLGTDIVINNGKLSRCSLHSYTKIRLISRFACRLSKTVNVIDDRKKVEYRLAYSTENSKQYQGEEMKFFIIPKKMVAAVQLLILRYPRFVRISNIPHSDMSALLQLATDLWEVNLIMTSKPI